ncbi:MAG: PH domain-containing protein [Synergistaceae bacterium]|nr:PH domain-containing protein [Synergistaceae bacterium]
MSEKFETHEYVPSMRSSYKCMLAIVALFIVALVLSFIKPIETHHNYLLGTWILWIIITAALLLYMKAKTLGVCLKVKPDEVEIVRGILGRQSTEISYRNLRSIDVNQTPMQRLLNIGDILIASSGTDGKEIVARNMSSPREIRDEIQLRERAPQNAAPAAPAVENAAEPEQAK